MADAFQRVTGHPPDGVWVAPGRVNLIGEHTDYNDGLVLPVAIDRTARVAMRLRGDETVRCVSLQLGGEVATTLADIVPGRVSGWHTYPLGVLWALAQAGVAVPGADVVIDSDVPSGAGLASSAALEVATAVAVLDLTGQALSSLELARCCQAGEQSIAGAPTGIMDPLVVLEGRDGHALLLDCRSLEREPVPFQPAAAGAALLVIDTGVAHATSGAGYRARRAECARAAAELNLPSLRDADLDDVGRLSGVLQRRARHVVTENERVMRAAELLRGGRLHELGPLLDRSHASLRDDFEVSCSELDLAVLSARAAGAWGARMTGAGFGGCAIALVPSGQLEAVTAAVDTAFAGQGYRCPKVFVLSTAGGARRLC